MNLKSNSLLSKRAFRALLSSLAMVMPMAAQASFVVEEGQVVGTQFLTVTGDTGLVELGGTIETSSTGGIIPVGAGLLTITNNGVITTTGATVIGIGVSPGSLATNNGLIQTTGAGAVGIFIPVAAPASPSTVYNNGLIITSGAGAAGIASTAAGTNITNNGDILTAGAGASGIGSTADAVKITNKGNIVVTGASSAGIGALGTNASVTNGGTIIATTNPNNIAIALGSSNATLNLLRRSNIQGAVAVALPSTLNVQKGLNLALTVTPLSGAGAFTTINTEGAPYATSGNLIAVVDRTGFAMEVDILDDLTAVVMNNLGSQYCFDCNDCCDTYQFDNDWKGWVRGFGSYRERRTQHRTVRFYNGLEGGMAGVEMPIFCDWTLGLFGGGSYGDAHTKHHTHVLKNTSGFGGLYLDGDICGNFVRFAITGGSLNQRSRRKVMNNTVEGGYEFARTKFNGGFVAPELRFGREFCLLGFDLIASADVRYSGLFLDRYNEHGSETNFRVKGHDVNIITTSSELALPITFEACGSCMTVVPYAGLEGRYRLGSKKLHGELLEQSIIFTDGSWNDIGIAFVGVRSCKEMDCGLSLLLDLEADFDNKKSALIRGGLKAEMAF